MLLLFNSEAPENNTPNENNQDTATFAESGASFNHSSIDKASG